jgi:hypothetical protein
MNKKLQKPSNEFIKNYIDSFDNDNRISLADRSIKCLIEKFPTNKNIEEILLKVIAINTLYSTSILDTIKMSQWILKCSIDADLNIGMTDLVNKIAIGHGIKSARTKSNLNKKEINFYSFASKYCSWHNHKSYPIYDSFVEKILVAYQKQDNFSNFKTIELKNFTIFKKVILDYISHYNLNFSLKEIDKFLWAYGKEMFPPSWAKTKDN